MRNSGTSSALVWVLIFLAILPGMGRAARAGGPIRVGAVFSMSGEASAVSIEHLVAVRFAVNEINRNGGLLGRQITLVEADNMSTALGSRNAARKMAGAGVAAVVGPSWSSHALATAPVLQEAGIPMITPLATNPKVTMAGSYIFRVCFIDTFQGQMLARFLHEDLNASKVAVLTNADQIYSIELTNRFINDFQDLGGKVPVRLNYLETAPGFRDLILRLKQHPFDALLVPGYSRDAAQIVRTARQMGVDLPIVGGDGWSHLMLNYAGREMDNCYYLTHWHRDQADKKSREFVARMSTLFNPTKINAGMALAYDAVYLLAHAVTKSGDVRPAKIRDALAATTDFTGVTGFIRFDKDRNPIKPAVVLNFRDMATRVVKTILPPQDKHQ